jgi:hypothetical protein
MVVEAVEGEKDRTRLTSRHEAAKGKRRAIASHKGIIT